MRPIRRVLLSLSVLLTCMALAVAVASVRWDGRVSIMRRINVNASETYLRVSIEAGVYDLYASPGVLMWQEFWLWRRLDDRGWRAANVGTLSEALSRLWPRLIHFEWKVRNTFGRQLRFPTWLPILFFMAVSRLLARPLFRTRQRRRQGQCVHCAYDLTGNVSGVCPECGTEIEKPSVQCDPS